MLTALALVLAACAEDEDVADDPPDEEEEPAEPDEPDEPDEPEDLESAAAEGPDVEITFGHVFPAEHPMVPNMLQPFMDTVEERTGGTVTFDVHPGAAITDADVVYENTVSGAIDMGWALHGYTPGRFPVTRIVELPFVWTSAEQATDGLWDLYEEFDAFQDEFDDTQVIAMWTHDIGDLWTVETPVTSPEDMQGLELRAPGPEQSNLIDALGGDPVGLPAGELFDSLDGGVIDGLMIAQSGLQSFDLFPTLQYGTKGGFYVAAMYTVMNLDTWDSLSPEQQQIIEEESGRELSLVAARAYDGIYDDLEERVQEEFDLTILEGDDLQEWIDATEAVPDNWIDDQADDVPAEEMVERLLEISGQ